MTDHLPTRVFSALAGALLLLLVPFGVHVQQPQNSVDGDGQEPNQGSKKFGNGADETRHSQGQLLRLFHG